MARHFSQIVCLLLLLALAGCKSRGLPDDPLFANRKPIESKAIAGPPVATPFYEPTPPPEFGRRRTRLGRGETTP